MDAERKKYTLFPFQFDSQSRSTLYVILFRSYMSLEYYDKAHHAIVSNQTWNGNKTA